MQLTPCSAAPKGRGYVNPNGVAVLMLMRDVKIVEDIALHFLNNYVLKTGLFQHF